MKNNFHYRISLSVASVTCAAIVEIELANPDAQTFTADAKLFL